MELTGKQEAFCQRYLIDFNATQAAISAGYSEDSASAIGWENLRKPEIQARIQELRKQMGANFNITRERIAQELARIAFGDTRKLFKEDGSLKAPHEWDDDTAAVIASIETEELFEGRGDDKQMVGYTKKIKQWEKTKALAQLAQLMGYNAPTKQELTGKDGGPIQVTGFNYLPPAEKTDLENKE